MTDRETPTTQGPRIHRYTIEEACQLTRLSRATLYERIAAGRLAVVKDGRRTFVTGAELERYLSAPGDEVAQ